MSSSFVLFAGIITQSVWGAVEIPWYSFDCGGALSVKSADELIKLSGTIGQPDAASLKVVADGVIIEIIGGFWAVSSTLPPIVCEGDTNGDGTVDPLDVGYVLSRFGCAVGKGDPGCDAADANGDGTVDPLDSGYVLARLGECI